MSENSKNASSSSAPAPKERPTVVRKTQDTLSEIDNELLSDDEDMNMPQSEMFAQMWSSVLGQFFAHVETDEEGNTTHVTNIVDMLAEINHNLNKNTQCIFKLYKEVERLNGGVAQTSEKRPSTKKS